MPSISSGLSAMSSITLTIIQMSGVMASPVPRKLMVSCTTTKEAGIERNTTSR